MTATTPASGFVSGADETKFFEYQIPASLFTNGDNTIAVELHQPDPANVDASFDLELVARNGNETNAPSAPAPTVDRRDLEHRHGELGRVDRRRQRGRLPRAPQRRRGRLHHAHSPSPDFGLTPNTAYSYDIRAVDTSGNVSAAGVASTTTTREHGARPLRRRLVLPGPAPLPTRSGTSPAYDIVVVAERAEPARLGRRRRDHRGPDRHAHPVLRPPLQRRRHHAVPAAHAAAEA